MSKHLTLRAMQPGTSLKQDFNHVVPVDALTALGWCKNPLASMLLKLRLGHVDHGLALASGPLLQWVVFETGRKRWAFRDADQLKQFGLQCVSEWLGEKCPICKGRDHRITRNGVVTICDPCGGTGRVRDAQKIRADAIGVARETISRTWAERFDYIVGELGIIERKAWRGERDLFGDME